MPSADVPVLSNLSSTASRTTRIRVLGSQMLVVNFLVAALIWMVVVAAGLVAEPPRESRRLFDLSYAAISVASCIA